MPTVTSENKAEFDIDFLKKKGVIKDQPESEEKPMAKSDSEKTKKMGNEQVERAKKHPKYAKLKAALGHKGAVDAILKELNDKQ
jgi:hypothetical protein